MVLVLLLLVSWVGLLALRRTTTITIRRAVSWGQVWLSENLRDRDPPRRDVHGLNRLFQLLYGLLNVVVDDDEVQEVTIQLFEHVRLLGEAF
ncbi:hypothetical protein Pmani_010202 [Petrolisthes manimaculis]|uniref:Secreted protein n=1 Tax=Petrolisthes manimaculis TaxID=1843537 RepID=A0AAE1Q3I4_9EUCA|nr:hypothetical protein Pmani_010202 [Petrolisthes manimaculis]